MKAAKLDTKLDIILFIENLLKIHKNNTLAKYIKNDVHKEARHDIFAFTNTNYVVNYIFIITKVIKHALYTNCRKRSTSGSILNMDGQTLTNGRINKMAPWQPSLFDQPTVSGVVRDIKTVMNTVVKESGKSRAQVLDLMNAFALRHRIKLNGGNALSLSTDVFEKWLNPEDEVRTPSLKALTVFCAVMGTCEPLGVMAKLMGSMIIEGDDIQLLAWAKMQRKMKATKAKIRKIEAEW